MCVTGIKLQLILSYKRVSIFNRDSFPIELLITTAVVSLVVLTTGAPQPTYSNYITPVDTVITTTEVVQTSDTIVSPESKKIETHSAKKPRVYALSGENQGVIDEILSTFPDAPVMVEIARCESGLNPSADRRGIDGGLFQINKVHLLKLNELGLDRYNLQDNLTYSRILFENQGLGPWYMSKGCWGQYS